MKNGNSVLMGKGRTRNACWCSCGVTSKRNFPFIWWDS